MESPLSQRPPTCVRLVRLLPIWLIEFLCFGLKEAASCAFAGAFFIVLAISPHLRSEWLPRYDAILLAALALQAAMLVTGLESRDELKTICLFHLLGFVLEVFKTQPGIGSWSYPEPGYTKLFGVPLYSGFMYAAVASYMIQAWRLFDLRLEQAPDFRWSAVLALAIYANFFTHHWIGDWRWALAALLLIALRRTRVRFTAWREQRSMPLNLSFVLIGSFVWLAENIATFFGAWVYPNQQHGWQVVHAGKISSWTLLVVITFVIVADLKHYKLLRIANRSVERAD